MKIGLIIFIKNPLLGKVKSRLAKTLGQEKALAVYKKLLEKTKCETLKLPIDKYLFYSEEILEDDWPIESFHKELQIGTSLGERMQNAFKLLFEKGYNKVMIIGSDCYDITNQIIYSSAQDLADHDIVIGPANDGGYYLLGANEFFPELFQNIKWSTPLVLSQTLEAAKNRNLKFKLKEELVDLDTFEDLKKSGFPLNLI